MNVQYVVESEARQSGFALRIPFSGVTWARLFRLLSGLDHCPLAGGTECQRHGAGTRV